MFVNIEEEGVAVNWDELHLYYSESPLGPWTAARAQPGRLRRTSGAARRTALLVAQYSISSQSGQLAALRLRYDDQ